MRFTKVADDISRVEAGTPILARFGVAVVKIFARCAFPAFIAVANTAQAFSMPACLSTTGCRVTMAGHNIAR
jgi:hypothetical protein